MGQAKQRGTREERIAQAQARDQENARRRKFAEDFRRAQLAELLRRKAADEQILIIT